MMCGRTACVRSSKEIAQACSYQNKTGSIVQPQWVNSSSCSYKPSYNKGPKSSSAVLLINCNYERVLQPMQWGLVPSWHKGCPKTFAFNMINARLDTLTNKKSFMNILQKGQRCIVLADGFYEWQTIGTKKHPYYIHLKDDIKPQPDTEEKQLLTMAGLFDKHSSEEGEIYTYTIITVDASDTFKVLHDRMPAILNSPDAVDKWLDTTSVTWENALKLLLPLDCLQWYPVSTFVNNVRHDSSNCLKRIDENDGARKSRSCLLMHNWLKVSDTNSSSSNRVCDAPSVSSNKISDITSELSTETHKPPSKKRKL
ncbi:abasic site processing protein HMCES isoform X1 [Hydra vulgaris]|uniref:abasic site processing protein HMCES isoform X1 n=2 Tax=Hydra vulgaris TaxID=6087 RepID=UPI001F5EE194|nr:abasic site processing protein HMCES [Hydra vulgaris]